MELTPEIIAAASALLIGLVGAGGAAAHKANKASKEQEPAIGSNVAVIETKLNGMSEQIQKIADKLDEGFQYRDEKRDVLAIAVATLQAEFRMVTQRVENLERLREKD